MRNPYEILVRRPERKRPRGRNRSTWDGNTEVDLKQIGRENLYCIHPTQDMVQCWVLVNTVMSG